MQGFEKLSPPDETIVAISTPPGRSGIGIVRLSGRDATDILCVLFRSKVAVKDRRATYGKVLTAEAEHVDDVIATTYKAPNSYTGEDVVEISAHGNPVVLDRIVDLAVAAGARRASPGEFTLRAVAAGKMDLAQAEAVRDFIEAQTQTQARFALLQMEGSLAKQVSPLKESLVGIVAELEAGIDFAEDDVPVPDGAQVAGRIQPISKALAELEQSFKYGRLIANGYCLAIAGKPNVGKSSVFNRLTAMNRAIVTEVPGTTRDVLTETVEIGGIPIRFADTAGVRETSDRVESIGVSRALEALAETDLALAVLDGSQPLDDDDHEVLSRVESLPHIVVINKQDLPGCWQPRGKTKGVAISAKTGVGLDQLRTAILDRIEGAVDAERFVVTNARQHAAISLACERLANTENALKGSVPHEVVLLELYSALALLGELTGEVATEDVLGQIFSTFCVGK